MILSNNNEVELPKKEYRDSTFNSPNKRRHEFSLDTRRNNLIKFDSQFNNVIQNITHKFNSTDSLTDNSKI